MRDQQLQVADMKRASVSSNHLQVYLLKVLCAWSHINTFYNCTFFSSQDFEYRSVLAFVIAGNHHHSIAFTNVQLWLCYFLSMA
jgi:hypothetical protein